MDNKKLSQARIKTYLVVDKPEIAEKSSEIFDELKKKSNILLNRDLTDQEQLMLSFSNERTANADPTVIDLEIKKKFFYVINPDGKIIDLASIYQFLHEDNIHQRIVTKISKDVDDRNTHKI